MDTTAKAPVTIVRTAIRSLTNQQLAEMADRINTHHGNLLVNGLTPYDSWKVSILDDDGGIEEFRAADNASIQSQLQARAIERGWLTATDDRTNIGNQQIFEIDLGHFDPWDLGYCVQVAAFGESIVG